MNFPASLPLSHEKVLLNIVSKLSNDQRICGIGLSGSYASNTMDIYSDLDFVIAIEPEYYQEIMNQRFDILNQFNDLLAAFTGEHVGEPRLVITLFGQRELVHVDFKFVSLEDAAERVDETKIIWQRDERLNNIFQTKKPEYPAPDGQWIEDRIWTWIHYGSTKIARGEYFEALDFISFLRLNALSPLALKQAGLKPSGVRTIEKRLPDFTAKLCRTVATPDYTSLKSALKYCISLYLELQENENVITNEKAKTACLAYFDNLD